MNKLSIEKRTQVITALVEGNSINATCRMTGAAKWTVLRLLASVGVQEEGLSFTKNGQVMRLLKTSTY